MKNKPAPQKKKTWILKDIEGFLGKLMASWNILAEVTFYMLMFYPSNNLIVPLYKFSEVSPPAQQFILRLSVVVIINWIFIKYKQNKFKLYF